jgi:hypothetical protein
MTTEPSRDNLGENNDVLLAERFIPLVTAMNERLASPIFRRFEDLTTLNLLMLQAELQKPQESFDAVSLTDDDNH